MIKKLINKKIKELKLLQRKTMNIRSSPKTFLHRLLCLRVVLIDLYIAILEELI